MNDSQSFDELLISQLASASVWEFMLNLVLCAVLAGVLKRVYVRYGRTLSNRRAFGRNFVMLSMTTMLIITVVQTSLALSLGLIGALSIVRFRAAIKEPEELAYLFLAIALGLGLGANQRFSTIVAFTIILLSIRGLDLITRDREEWDENAYLTVTTSQGDTLTIDAVRGILETHCARYRTKRVDKHQGEMEAFFLVECRDGGTFQAIEGALREHDPAVKLSFLDHRGGSLAGP